LGVAALLEIAEDVVEDGAVATLLLGIWTCNAVLVALKEPVEFISDAVVAGV
jgi:hypothetical protein